MTECDCYLYPDPEPEPGGGGTGSGGGSGSINPPNPGTSEESPTPLYSPAEQLEYYNKRVEDFKKRYPGKEPPTYYQYYGDFYMREFLYKTKGYLSAEGQVWVDITLLKLQELMEEGLLAKENIHIEENNNDFINFAFNTHVDAYVKGGILQLSMTDKLFILTTVYPSDLFSVSGMTQVRDIMGLQLDAYRIDQAFAWQQAQELMRNQEVYKAIIATYLFEKAKEYPRPSTRASTLTEEQMFYLMFGKQIEYFQSTFGDQFQLNE